MDKGTYNARKQYYKQWRAKNKDKVHKYNVQYWERKAIREQMQREMQSDGDDKAVSDH